MKKSRIWAQPISQGFPCSLVGKESACSAGDPGLIPGLGRSPVGGHGNPLQHSRWENPHGQRNLVSYSAWGHKSWTRLSNQTTIESCNHCSQETLNLFTIRYKTKCTKTSVLLYNNSNKVSI